MLRFTSLVKPLLVALALTAAFVWSSDDRGLAQEAPPEPPLAPNTLSAERFNTCVVTHTRAAECWGSNAAGGLGVGSTVDVGFESTRPIPVMRLKHGVVAVSSGSQSGEASHSCVVLTGGRVQCWGANAQGQLGDKTTDARSVPADVCADTTCSDPLTDIVAISAGGRGTAQILQENPPPPTTTAHTCAVTASGAVKCWGENGSGQLGDGTAIDRLSPVDVCDGAGTPCPPLSGVVAIAAGANHSCALLDIGAVKCWGANDRGQLGDGQTCGTGICVTPTDVTGLTSGVVAISASNHTCAVLDSGQVKCWGENLEEGRLGDGTTQTHRTTPVTVCASGSGTGCTALTGIETVSLGRAHTCAIATSRAVTCWGRNLEGQLGDGTTTDRKNPVAVAELDGTSEVTAIALGGRHTCAKISTGRVVCWGDNSSIGLLGNGKSIGMEKTPVAALVVHPSISAGYGSTCALTNAGAVVCWGTAQPGPSSGPPLLGNGFFRVPRPVHVIDLESGVVAVSVGNSFPTAHFACAVIDDATVECWGFNPSGQLGDGTTTNRETAVTVSGLSDVVAVTAGSDFLSAGHACAVTKAGGVKCWGGGFGTTPVDVCVDAATPCTPLSGVVAVSAGGEHTCALTDVGSVKCWGENADGQLGDGTTSDSTTPVDVCIDDAFPCEPLTDVVAITASRLHSCAVLSTGAAKCWGENDDGQLGDGTLLDRLTPVDVCDTEDPCTPLAGVVDIEGGFDHTCALVEHATGPYAVKCWGEGDWGTLGNDTGGEDTNFLHAVYVCATGATAPCSLSPGDDPILVGATTITGGFYHTCVTFAPGGAKCWGDRDFGAVGDNQFGTGDPLPEATDARTPVSVDDGDECTDVQENGPAAISGGLRDPLDYWDFYDTPDGNNVRDGIIDSFDVNRILPRFGANDAGGTAPINRYSDVFSPPPPAPGYHPAFDRSPAPIGADPWDHGPPDGYIDLFFDAFGAAVRDGDTCE